MTESMKQSNPKIEIYFYSTEDSAISHTGSMSEVKRMIWYVSECEYHNLLTGSQRFSWTGS